MSPISINALKKSRRRSALTPRREAGTGPCQRLEYCPSVSPDPGRPSPRHEPAAAGSLPAGAFQLVCSPAGMLTTPRQQGMLNFPLGEQFWTLVAAVGEVELDYKSPWPGIQRQTARP